VTTVRATAGRSREPAASERGRPLPSVLLIGPTPPPYHGVAVFLVMTKASRVLARRFRVLHLDTSDRRGLDNMGRLDPGNVYYALRHGAELLLQIARHRPDVVYLPIAQNTWGSVRDAWLLLIARVTGRRIVTHLHGSDWRRFHDSAPAVVRWVLRRGTGWVHAAGVLGDGLRPLYDGLIAPERVHVAAPWIEDPFPEGPPARTAGAGVTVAYIGMLFRPKGYLHLVEAAGMLGADEVRVVIAGAWFSEAERRDAEELVARLGVQDRVTFTGRLDEAEKRQLLVSADIFVFPGYQPEGLPLAVLEAMAAGLPVVATPVGTIPDAIRHGEEGMIVQPHRPAELAAAIDALAADVDARCRMGAAARRRFEEHYTETRAVAELADLLESGLNASRGDYLPQEPV
jgi:glycosyltransferase involved in cell wall biosynthesis